MSELYSASDLAKIAEDPEALNEKLNDIITRAHARALEGERFIVITISEFDPLFKPVIRRLGELGYDLEYRRATFQGKGQLTINW